MTNAEKYLKDGVSVEEFCKGFYQYLVSKDKISFGYDKSNVGAYLQNFLNEQVKPTLTEDERVILKNIDTDYYPTIKRMGRTLYLVDKEDAHKEIEYMFKDRLFQFIQERRRI